MLTLSARVSPSLDRSRLIVVMRPPLRLGAPLRALLIVLMIPPLRVGGALRAPPPPVATPLASSLRAPSRGDPPHDGPAAAGNPVKVLDDQRGWHCRRAAP